MNGLYRTVRTGMIGLIAKKILRIKQAFPLTLHIKFCAHPITAGDENSATCDIYSFSTVRLKLHFNEANLLEPFAYLSQIQRAK